METREAPLAGVATVLFVLNTFRVEPGQVAVTGTVKDLVAGSGLVFEPLGERALKGVPGSWPIYAVTDG